MDHLNIVLVYFGFSRATSRLTIMISRSHPQIDNALSILASNCIFISTDSYQYFSLCIELEAVSPD